MPRAQAWGRDKGRGGGHPCRRVRSDHARVFPVEKLGLELPHGEVETLDPTAADRTGPC